MEPEQKRNNAIGLAMKAGKLKSGDFIVEKLVRAGGVRLVLIDETASDNTREKYAHLCENTHTILLAIPELGMAIGKPGRIVAAVTDTNFTNLIQSVASNGIVTDEGTRG